MIRRPRPCRVVFDGQSRMALPTWDGFLGRSWGRILMAGRGIPSYLVAASGQSITDLTADFKTRSLPKIAGPREEPTIVVLGDVGASDIIDEGDNAATVYSQAGAYADLCRAAGAAYVMVCTTLPSDLFSPAQDVIRLAANALYMADASAKFDAKVDICQPGLLDTANRDVYYDGTHVYGPHPIAGIGLGLGTPHVAKIVAPYLDAAIEAVT